MYTILDSVCGWQMKLITSPQVIIAWVENNSIVISNSLTLSCVFKQKPPISKSRYISAEKHNMELGISCNWCDKITTGVIKCVSENMKVWNMKTWKYWKRHCRRNFHCPSNHWKVQREKKVPLHFHYTVCI